jgi:hypothetical protein
LALAVVALGAAIVAQPSQPNPNIKVATLNAATYLGPDARIGS